MRKKILVVDDAKLNRELIHNILNNNYETLEAENGQEALEILKEQGQDIAAVLLDIIMPVIDGYGVLTAMRQHSEWMDIPVLIMTADAAHAELKTLSMGANDFLTKPFNPHILQRRLANIIKLHEKSEVIINAGADHDPLTGLLNREGFFEAVERLVAAKPNGYYILTCFDIDNFKFVNDRYGIAKGDAVLKYVANSCAPFFTDNGGCCARIMADNFAALFPAELVDAPELRAMHKLEATYTISGTLGFSVGRYLIIDKQLEPSAMYDRAFIAKKSVKGRFDNHLAYFDESMLTRLLHEQEVTDEMYSALKGKQFHLWLQPQYNHATGALIGAEALVRWLHPDKSIIAPNSFIPVFEANGFIYELDKYMWEEACKLQHRWFKDGQHALPISVNISRYDLLRPDFFEVITGLLKKYDIPANLLPLEITESAFAKADNELIRVVKSLIDYGFTIEIDDFGSGYSSLNTLKDVPANIIKLDMRFLEDSGKGNRGGNILESIVRMAKWLDMPLIAEGVETKEQADYLKSIGCYYIQGYYYAKPMPVKDYEVLVNTGARQTNLKTLKTVKGLDNNTFWDPNSLDTLIFNSYVDGACIFEYVNGKTEILRVNEKYREMLFPQAAYDEKAAVLSISPLLDTTNSNILHNAIQNAIDSHKECICEIDCVPPSNNGKRVYLRLALRVIASADDRMLFYASVLNLTPLRESEQKERNLSAQLQAIMENIDSGVSASVIVDGVPHFVFVNDQYFKHLGYTREQYFTEVKSPFDIIHPDDRAEVVRQSQLGEASGQPFSCFFRVLLRNGDIGWFRSRVNITRLPDVEGVVHLAVYNDVTERQLIQQKQQNIAAQMQAIMQNVSSGITASLHDEEGRIKIVFANDRFFSMLGFTREEYDALPDPYQLLHPEDLPRIRATITKLLREHSSASYEYRCYKKDGAMIYIHCNAVFTPIAGIGEQVLLSVSSDLTNIISTQQQLRLLIDNVNSGVFAVAYLPDREHYIFANNKFYEMHGFTKEQFEAEVTHTMDLIYKPDRANIIALSQKHNKSGKPFKCTYRVVKRDGEVIWVQANVSFVYMPGIKERVHLGVVKDITEELKWDAQQKEYQEALPFTLEAIMEAAPDLVFAKDLKLNYICCSNGFLKATGKIERTRDVVGKTDYDLFAKTMADEFTKQDKLIIETGQPLYSKVQKFKAADGSTHYSEVTKLPLHDRLGNTIGIYGYGQDITQARNQLQQLQLLTDNIPGGLASFVVTKTSVHSRYLSEGVYKLLDYDWRTEKALPVADALAYVHNDDLVGVKKALDALWKGSNSLACTYRMHTLNGGYKWINLIGSVTERTEDELIVSTAFFDVSATQEANERLRVKSEEYRLALTSSGNMLARYNITDKTLFLSPDAATIMGLPEVLRDIPYNKDRLGRIALESKEAYVDVFEDIMSGKRNGTTSYKTLTVNGNRWFKLSYTTIFGDVGKPVSAIIALSDITDQREKEHIYKHWINALHEKPADSYSLFRCNLSKNTAFESCEGTLLNIDYSPEKLTFDERTEEYVNQCVYWKDRQKYINTMSSDTLLANYYRGTNSITLEYREESKEQNIRWLRLTIKMMEYPHSKDIEVVLIFEDIDEEKKAELMIKELTEKDPLTGVLNRTTFTGSLEKILAASAADAQHALLMLDMDGFKQLNDTFGHAAGDQALKEIADALQGIIRDGDLLGRLGGDEFLVFLPNISGDTIAAAKAKQICALLNKSYSPEVQLSASIGIAMAPRDGKDFDLLYRKADLALYHVKDLGKGSYSIFETNMLNDLPNVSSNTEHATRIKLSQKKKPRMLIIDDSKLDYAMLCDLFRERFTIEKAADTTAALTRLRHYGAAISVILMDLYIAGTEGFKLLEKLRASADLQTIPIIALGVDPRPETALKAIQSGASEYVLQPIDPELLKIRVDTVLSKAENERLRAQNNYLVMQNDAVSRYRTILEHAGIASVQYDWINSSFAYDSSMSDLIAGHYDSRRLWHIFLSDMVATVADVQKMQTLVHEIAIDRKRYDGRMLVKLKTPKHETHWFQMIVYKRTNDFHLTDKLIITFRDINEEIAGKE